MQAPARLVVRKPWAWIVGWFVAAIALFVPAPRIPTLLQDSAQGFLPSDLPSERALQRLRQEFPEDAHASRAAIVFARDAGLTADDRAYVDRIASALVARSNEWGWKITATASSPLLRPLLESPNGCAAVVVVNLPSGNLTHHSVRRVREIQAEVGKTAPPSGLRIEVTGNAALGELLDSNAKRDIDMTTAWAFAAVAIILLLVYRSPPAMLLPLLTVGVGLLVVLGGLGWAAVKGWPINGLMQMFIIVLLAGLGVDCCLFLYARFREELAPNPFLCSVAVYPRPFPESATHEGRRCTRSENALGVGIAAERSDEFIAALERALTRTGPAILASAGTIAAGLATLALARNRDLYTSGPTIAAAVAVQAAAVVTLAPALMAVAGRWLFWPGPARPPGEKDRPWWRWAGRAATMRPVATTAVIVVLLAAMSAPSFNAVPLYDTLEEFPEDSSFVRGARLYENQFHGGRGVTEVTLLVDFPEALDTTGDHSAAGNVVSALRRGLSSEFPLEYWRDVAQPLGEAGSIAGGSEWSSSVLRELGGRLAESHYVSRNGRTLRIELGLRVVPRSLLSLGMVKEIRAQAERIVRGSDLPSIAGASGASCLTHGEAAQYADLRDLRRRDFRVVAVAAIVVVGVVLYLLLRSWAEAAVLIAGTLATYGATYGATSLIFRFGYGMDGLAWQLDFLLFVILLSLGQDYNIFVVSRLHEEQRIRPFREAVDVAVRRTGRVVSSCGIIMAATFASMFSGSLMVVKEFAVALSLGVLLDTFLVRPLLVPAMLVLTRRAGRQEKAAYAGLPLADSAPIK